jgi:hypothetical protein
VLNHIEQRALAGARTAGNDKEAVGIVLHFRNFFPRAAITATACICSQAFNPLSI